MDKKGETKNQLGKLAIRTLDNLELDGFLQFALKSFQHLLNEEKLGSILQNLLLSVVSSLRKLDDTNRKSLLLHIRTELKNIQDDMKLLEEIKKWKDKLIADWEPAEEITEVLQKHSRKHWPLLKTASF